MESLKEVIESSKVLITELATEEISNQYMSKINFEFAAN